MAKGMIRFALTSLHLSNPGKEGFRISEIRNYLDEVGILYPTDNRRKDLSKITNKIRIMMRSNSCGISCHPENRVNRYGDVTTRIYFITKE